MTAECDWLWCWTVDGWTNNDRHTTAWFQRQQQAWFECARVQQHGRSVSSVRTSLQPTRQDGRRTRRRRTVMSLVNSVHSPRDASIRFSFSSLTTLLFLSSLCRGAIHRRSVRQAELTFIHNCWYQQFELLISTMRHNCWYQQFELLILLRGQCVWKTIIRLGLGKKGWYNIITKHEQQQQLL